MVVGVTGNLTPAREPSYSGNDPTVCPSDRDGIRGMNFLRLLPVILSSLVIGAHFMRAGLGPLVALSLLVPFLLLFRERWVARVVQCFLVLAALEWVRTALVLVAERQQSGRPWTRLVVILGFVTAFTAVSPLVFCCRSLATRYGLLGGRDEPEETGDATDGDAPS